ncbi:MAG TPA: ATP-grasp fold amidoligase family protein [Cerasibacillus sp.]|uniref:ATP-grasp fold amidoligase family protein n=1 Tax=Cerasibacillus sp. TaxID=2498711 RepID=UPI002F3E4A32
MTQKLKQDYTKDQSVAGFKREENSILTNRSQPKNEEKEALVQQLLETEEQLQTIEKGIQRTKKDIKQIEASPTWKISKPIRKTERLFHKMSRREQLVEQERLIYELQTKLQATEKALYEANQKVRDNQFVTQTLHEDQITRYIRELRDRGELIPFLNEMVSNKEKLNQNYVTALTYIARLYMNENEDYRDWIYNKVFSALTNEETPEFMMRPGLRDENPVPLMHVSSFRGSLNRRMREKQLAHEPLPEWLLDDKQKAYTFVEQLGIRTPWVADTTYKLEDLPTREGVVIKPADGAGSRGVYLVKTIHDIVDLKRSKQLTSWDELLESMQKDLHINWVDQDEWLMEELILEDPETTIPARDVKFYTFYGKVGIILEIQRYPEAKYCWWTETGQRIHVGKYTEQVFKGKGVTPEEMVMVEELSKQIPAPFVRIDFLRSHNGLVFGEFTPKPGNYDEFNKEIDQLLGDYYIDAENRLTNDLLVGKRFEGFKAFSKKFTVNEQ